LVRLFNRDLIYENGYSMQKDNMKSYIMTEEENKRLCNFFLLLLKIDRRNNKKTNLIRRLLIALRWRMSSKAG